MIIRPIPFCASTALAIYSGTKTQTRRILKPQPNEGVTGAGVISRSGEGQTDEWTWLSGDLSDIDGWSCEENFRTGYCPGDKLWVREAWRTKSAAYDDLRGSEMDADYPIVYEADIIAAGGSSCPGGSRLGRYRHARFMPRWASRLTLTITDVRVERLQEISEDDAIAEGIIVGKPMLEIPTSTGDIYWSGIGDGGDPLEWSRFPVSAYQDLWNAINGPDAWDNNPWVAALTFSVATQNIDTLQVAA